MKFFILSLVFGLSVFGAELKELNHFDLKKIKLVNNTAKIHLSNLQKLTLENFVRDNPSKLVFEREFRQKDFTYFVLDLKTDYLNIDFTKITYDVKSVISKQNKEIYDIKVYHEAFPPEYFKEMEVFSFLVDRAVKVYLPPKRRKKEVKDIKVDLIYHFPSKARVMKFTKDETIKVGTTFCKVDGIGTKRIDLSGSEVQNCFLIAKGANGKTLRPNQTQTLLGENYSGIAHYDEPVKEMYVYFIIETFKVKSK